jgi:hypothetical protein
MLASKQMLGGDWPFGGPAVYGGKFRVDRAGTGSR